MNGMSAHTGKAIDDLSHLRQSIIDILTTPIGSRVIRRDYGSRLPELVDSPINNSGLMDLYDATYTALARWEPRLAIQNVTITPDKGRVTLAISGIYQPTGNDVRLDNVSVGAA